LRESHHPWRGFISLTEKIDTTTPGGKLIFHLMGALAEFERDLIRERTTAGLAAARERGRVGGSPKRLATNGKVALARRLFADPNHSVPEICSTLGISRSTLYRYVRMATPPASDS
jgi:DNA invertase Pin-like site-specific DNA recombinase